MFPCLTRAALAVAFIAVPARALHSQAGHQHGDHPPEKLGRVVFPTSCTPEAQGRFERAIALLHSFWYEEAGQAFTQVTDADPRCAMGYWGRAMSTLHPLWSPPSPDESAAALAAAERAVELSRPGSRERDYAEAIATYYRDHGTVDHKTRLLAYEKAMAGVAERHRNDPEAQTFHALALIAVGQLDAGDTTYRKQRQAGRILEPLFRRSPEHPGLAHYLIHAYDAPSLARRAVAAAERYARIAPSVPHAQHMPSHIYTRIGAWDASIASNLRSAAAARRYEEARGLDALWDQRGHALDYLTYAYLQQGKDAEAKRIVDEVKGVTAVYPPNSMTNAYALAAIPARYALERNRWADAKALAVRPSTWAGTDAITHFARAIGAGRSGDTAAGRVEIDTLARIEAALAEAGGPQAYWSTQVKIQRLAASAWVARAAGDTAEAVRQAAAAADLEDVTEKLPVTPGPVLPARELYGDLLLELGRAAEARAAYETALIRQPNRARSLYGAARAAEIAGDRAAAREHYRGYLRLMAMADSSRPELSVARRALVARSR